MNEVKKNFSKWMYWFLLAVAIILVYKFLDNFTAIGNAIGKFLLVLRQPLHIDILVISKSIGIFSFILTVNSGIPYCPPVFTDISHHKIITSSYLPHSIIIFSHLSYPSCELFRHNV